MDVALSLQRSKFARDIRGRNTNRNPNEQDQVHDDADNLVTVVARFDAETEEDIHLNAEN